MGKIDVDGMVEVLSILRETEYSTFANAAIKMLRRQEKEIKRLRYLDENSAKFFDTMLQKRTEILKDENDRLKKRVKELEQQYCKSSGEEVKE